MSKTMGNYKKHDKDYTNNGNAFMDFTVGELQWWVRLLRKRATMRTDEAKKQKDLYDADNYQEMLNDKLKKS